MTLSTRVAVMNHGRFEQIGTPGEVYEHPCNRFVADFVGKINLLDGSVEAADGGAVLVRCQGIDEPIRAAGPQGLAAGTPVCVALRPEKIFIGKEPPAEAGRARVAGVVFDLAYFGNLSLYRVRTAGGRIIEVSAQNRRREARRHLEWDDEVYLSWDEASAVLLTE